ncbi:MAG: hypothetical protein IJW97_01035 [Clostridia bacterium]|nr:hypothetical protein [Clostridia bacterium]
MKLIVCLDDKGGMAFNRRRQSRDRLLCEDVVRTAGGATLWMHPYSVPLFESLTGDIKACEDYLDAAGKQDVCFCERETVGAYAARIDTVVVYRWNRRYPGDVFFDLDVGAAPWRCVEIGEFVGSSHEKITKEVYVK